MLLLDIGAGSGRYCIPLLVENKELNIVAVEPCQKAQKLLHQRAVQSGVDNRLEIYTELSQVGKKTFHCIILIFGVLSHITDEIERSKLLFSTFNLLADSGHIICTVPNIFRRFPMHVFCNIMKEQSFRDAGNIIYERKNGSSNLTLKYHLYSPSTIKKELHESGYSLVNLCPESIFPETFVTSSAKISKLDWLLSFLSPSIMGYGLLTIAKK